MRKENLLEFFKYGIVGFLAFLVDFGFLVILKELLHIYYLIAAAISFTAGLTLNYLLSITWVFKNRKLKNKTAEFIIFALVGVVGLGLNEIFLWFFTDITHLYYLYSKLLATGLVFLWNFIARKSLLF